MADTTRTRRLLDPEQYPNVRDERRLLWLAGAFVAINASALNLLRAAPPTAWLPLAVWVLAACLGHLLLNRWLPRRDPFLYPVAMLLSGWGMVAIDRLAPWVVAGVALVAPLSLQPAHRWHRAAAGLHLLRGQPVR
ncbi:MAG: hypothetical protein MUC99_12845 [Anaerolineae bacterium]|nr:hypothetical protein [Anaerolineae bacterium]